MVHIDTGGGENTGYVKMLSTMINSVLIWLDKTVF